MEGWTWADIWLMAGVLRMEWRHRCLRELWAMYQFAIMDNYDHTCGIMSASSWGKTSPTKLHPFRKDQSSTKISGHNMDSLGVFTQHRGRNG